ncbi:molybdopterin converting factor subunit 1 [Motilimonas pumila]|uniref:Molybdopterin synthase sulfur carrier subunit n=1 Tax=Motilimonas pumila TaxID=2303987 RepID=A0A418YG31_9GAMM|nr:molybdopterin converting factor subunit 1 [Motilimonas pumila]RJG48493.1 molybdopterin converting factor subunit 1 [Motilimonas pumila]
MIKVCFFAKLREQFECDELSLEANNITQVKDVITQLVTLHPSWQSELKQSKCLVAVNHAMAKADTAVNSGDEVAFFPPVTGG